MGSQVNLLKSLPKTIRTSKMLEERKQVKLDGGDSISQMYGREYFDGHRKYGYNGYHKDDRWSSVADDIIKHYILLAGADSGAGSKVLDVGCAKGYLVEELCDAGMNAYGIDVSKYAVQNCSMDMVGRIHHGNILNLHFPDNSFDLVLCINVVHNIDEWMLHLAFKELQRVSKKDCFITVDSYRTEEEEAIFEDWVLTAKSHGYPYWWLDKFKEYGYTGDYDFTIWTSGCD